MQQNKERILTGVVLSISGDKSIRVSIDYRVKHPKYGKYIKRRTRLAVHDQHNVGRVGDVVEISECRPRSKNKSWRLVKVTQKAG